MLIKLKENDKAILWQQTDLDDYDPFGDYEIWMKLFYTTGTKKGELIEPSDESFSGFLFCDCDRWYSSAVVGSRLCFISREVAVQVGKQFTDLYKEYFVL